MRRLLLALLISAALVAVVASRFHGVKVVSSAASGAVTIQPVQAVSSSTPLLSHALARSSREAAWRRFRESFGDHLDAAWSADGRLTVVRGKPGRGSRASGRFSPEDVQAAVARAREVLGNARGLLGLNPGLPLGSPTVRTGPVSAQVAFRESLEGLPVLPVGVVLVDLGPQGEILNLSSDYVPSIRLANARRLSADQARVKAQAAAPVEGAERATLGGRAVIWVTRDAVGRYAYSYWVAGRKVVIDAESGEVLYEKDERQF